MNNVNVILSGKCTRPMYGVLYGVERPSSWRGLGGLYSKCWVSADLILNGK